MNAIFYNQSGNALLKEEGRTLTSILLKMRYRRLVGLTLCTSLTYFTLHEGVYFYLNSYCQFPSNFWVTHSLSSLALYQFLSKYAFRNKVADAKGIRKYVMHFMIFNGFVEMWIRKHRDRLTIDQAEYR